MHGRVNKTEVPEQTRHSYFQHATARVCTGDSLGHTADTQPYLHDMTHLPQTQTIKMTASSKAQGNWRSLEPGNGIQCRRQYCCPPDLPKFGSIY